MARNTLVVTAAMLALAWTSWILDGTRAATDSRIAASFWVMNILAFFASSLASTAATVALMRDVRCRVVSGYIVAFGGFLTAVAAGRWLTHVVS